jgi:hypothetical protein
MNQLACTSCGHVGLGEGYVSLGGSSVGGFAVWVSGLLQRNAIGGTTSVKRRPKFIVEVFRCPACGHLELFANQAM